MRAASRVDYSVVRSLKARALRRAFSWFADNLWGTGDRRDRSLRAFEERERWWLDDFGLFRALHDEQRWSPLARLGARDQGPRPVGACGSARAARVADRYYAYLQWVADEQWQRAGMESAPVGVFGDFPFMVSGHSADVWARQYEFDLDSSVGTPPDAFSATGQDWGLPAYPMGRCRRQRLRLAPRSDAPIGGVLRRLSHRSPDRFLSHLRAAIRWHRGFVPADEALNGRRASGCYRSSARRRKLDRRGSRDVPDFLRVSLAERGIPG